MIVHIEISVRLYQPGPYRVNGGGATLFVWQFQTWFPLLECFASLPIPHSPKYKTRKDNYKNAALNESVIYPHGFKESSLLLIYLATPNSPNNGSRDDENNSQNY